MFDSQIKLAILHVNPVSKAVTLTQLAHLVTPDLAPRSRFGSLELGDTIKDASVKKSDKQLGVFVKLPEKVLGLAYVSTDPCTILYIKLLSEH